MKVFRMSLDIDRYQFLLPEHREDAARLRMDGTPKQDTWVPPPVYVLTPKLPAGNFYQPNNSILITDPRATDVLRRYLEWAGELLPLPYKDEIFTLLNVTECVDVLDYGRTVFAATTTPGDRGRILQPAFHANRFGEMSLFKIPEQARSQIYVVEGANDFEMEFREAVAAAGLQGLIFEEVWSNDDDEDEEEDRQDVKEIVATDLPPSLREIQGVIAVAMHQDCDGVPITLTSIEVYDDGFRINARFESEAAYPHRTIHLPWVVRDDRGTIYRTWDGGRNDYRNPDGEWMHWIATNFSPPLDNEARTIRLELRVVQQMMYDTTLSPPGYSPRDLIDGPWIFNVPIPPRIVKSTP